MGLSLFSGINKYLLLSVLFLGIFIAIQLLFGSYKKGQGPIANTLPTLTPFPPPSQPAEANLEFYRTIRNGQPVTEGQIVTSEYKGKLIDLTISEDILLKIDNGQGFENELRYPKNVTLESGSLTLSELKIGDNVALTETSDVSKSYPESIQKIKIVSFTE